LKKASLGYYHQFVARTNNGSTGPVSSFEGGECIGLPTMLRQAQQDTPFVEMSTDRLLPFLAPVVFTEILFDNESN
jgi:hypothetical protein